jgi:hypothetical protein
MNNKLFIYLIFKLQNLINILIINFYGDWGLGIGDWGLGIGPNPQSPIPNPQSPIPISI